MGKKEGMTMSQIIFDNGKCISMGAVSKEDDLSQKGRISVNPPPADGRCYVCGKHMSELKPFGGPGDPLVGDFTGELLVKSWRWEGPHNEEAEKAWEEADKAVPEGEDLLPWFISKYGREKGEDFYHYSSPYVGSSWECRDCILLDDDEYLKVISERYWAENKGEDKKNS